MTRFTSLSIHGRSAGGLMASALSLAAAVSVGGLTGCATSNAGCCSSAGVKFCDEGPNAEDEARALAKLDEEWSAAAVRRDLNAVVSFYAEDAVVYPPNEPAVIGKAAAAKVWGQMINDPDFSIAWKATSAEVSCGGEMGWTAGTYESSFKTDDGSKSSELGKFLCVWKKDQNGEWKAIRDMWNTDSEWVFAK